MRKLSTSFIPEVILVLSCLQFLHAQTPATASPANSSATATPSPAGQAPDEMTKKITDLVHAEKYAEAQKLTEGLLVAYPDDQRLIKAKELIAKILAPVNSTTAVPSGSLPAQYSAMADAEQLTGMDKVDYNALIELARQAQTNTDLEQQTRLLRQFMTDSGLFLQRHPNEMLLWQLRAASAISLNDLVEGYDAGQRLIALGASDSNDSNMQHLLAQLKNKGWLDKKTLVDFQRKAELERYTFQGEHQSAWKTFRGRLTLNKNEAVYEGADGTIRISLNEIREISQFHYGVKFSVKDGKDFWFFPYYESDIVDEWQKSGSRNDHEFRLKKESILLDAIVERWRFASTQTNEYNRTLKPPTP